MKKYIVKNINVVICFCLLTLILALSVAVLKNEKNAGANSAPIPGDMLLDTSIDIPKVETPLSPALNYKTVLPKPPTADENFLFSQDICGIGNINLLSLHQTALGIFIVGSSDCVYGDLAGNRPGIGIAKLDTSGTVKSTYCLPSQSSATYVTSQVTALGLVIITSDTDKNQYFINIVSYDFSSLSTLVITSGIKAKIVPTRSSFLILTEYEKETIIYDYSSGKLKFYSIGTMSLVELFEYNDFYLMFCNTPSGYEVIKVSKSNYVILNQTVVNGATLVAVKPAVENNQQIFIIIESSDSTYAKKVDSNLNFTLSYKKKLGNFNIKAICQSQNELLIIASGNINGMITLGYDLSVSYADSSSKISKIFQTVYYKNAYYYLASTDNALCLIKIVDGVCVYNYLQINSNLACFAINTNDTLTLVYAGNFYEYASIQIKGVAL